ncbi:MAG TPA: hypothetical protein VK486_01160, partial [Thermoleophilaceae bacterium]|nr:hypothetical protein [Thermoleophilaceae bacterium]
GRDDRCHGHVIERDAGDLVLRAATTRAAGDDTTDRAQLHRWHRPLVVPQVALVTLEHTSVDIVMSVER